MCLTAYQEKTREVFIIVGGGNKDIRHNEIIQKLKFCQFVNTAICQPRTQALYVLSIQLQL